MREGPRQPVNGALALRESGFERRKRRRAPEAKQRFEAVGATGEAEEMLRLESSVQGLPRVATCDIEIAGVTIPNGSNIVLCPPAANRDPVRWPHAAEFDLDRPANVHWVAAFLNDRPRELSDAKDESTLKLPNAN